MHIPHQVLPLPYFRYIKIDDKNPKEKYVGFLRWKSTNAEAKSLWMIYRESVDPATKITTIEYASEKHNCCWTDRSSYFEPIP